MPNKILIFLFGVITYSTNVIANENLLSKLNVINNNEVLIEWEESKNGSFQSYWIYALFNGEREAELIASVSDQFKTALLFQNKNERVIEAYYVGEMEKPEYTDLIFTPKVKLISQKAEYLQVEFEAPEEFDYVEVLRSKQGDHLAENLGRFNSNVVFSDTTLFCNQSYTYKFKFHSNELNFDMYSNPLKINNLSNRKQAKVSSKIKTSDGFELIKWEQSDIPKTHLYYYLIYGVNVNGEQHLLAQLTPEDKFYLNTQKQYSDYKIETVSRCESSMNNQFNNDLFLDVERQNFTTSLRWSPVKKWKEGVEYYEVQKMNSEGEWETIEIVDGENNTIKLDE